MARPKEHADAYFEIGANKAYQRGSNWGDILNTKKYIFNGRTFIAYRSIYLANHRYFAFRLTPTDHLDMAYQNNNNKTFILWHK